jgi:hypothetical protein
MANYCPFVRSNYVQVKDPAAFEAFCKKWGVELIRGGKDDALFGFLVNEETGLPRCYYDSDQDDWLEGDLLKDLSTHLAPGWVAIIREIGYEKMRYLVGYTVAINWQGDTLEVSLDDIYEDAKRLGKHITHCEY